MSTKNRSSPRKLMQVYASLSILIADTKIVHLETPRKYINVPEANFNF